VFIVCAPRAVGERMEVARPGRGRQAWRCSEVAYQASGSGSLLTAPQSPSGGATANPRGRRTRPRICQGRCAALCATRCGELPRRGDRSRSSCQQPVAQRCVPPGHGGRWAMEAESGRLRERRLRLIDFMAAEQRACDVAAADDPALVGHPEVPRLVEAVRSLVSAHRPTLQASSTPLRLRTRPELVAQLPRRAVRRRVHRPGFGRSQRRPRTPRWQARPPTRLPVSRTTQRPVTSSRSTLRSGWRSSTWHAAPWPTSSRGSCGSPARSAPAGARCRHGPRGNEPASASRGIQCSVRSGVPPLELDG
jgi:hypothetical protein